MSGPTPDPARLAAVRSVARGYLERKRRWSKGLFVFAAMGEASLFGAMLFVFDFSDRLYWFIFFGLCFVYSPLITFIMRNSILLDRLYYRLVLELKFSDGATEAHTFERSEPGGREATEGFLRRRERFALLLFVLAALFEGGLWFTTLYFMDFSEQLDWFLFVGFNAVYVPLIISAWRNTFTIDRVYYGLLDELKYGAPGAVEVGSAGASSRQGE